MDKPERIDKILSNMGFGTRSKVKKLLKTGLVKVDGMCQTDGGVKVSPELNLITVDGKPIEYKKYIYLMLNKPKGYITATRDAHKTTVVDLVPEAYRHYNPFPVGRLDIDTEGLLFLTNDGELAHRLLSPKKHVGKKYFVKLDKPVDDLVSQAFAEGVTIDGGYVCLPAGLSVINGTEVEVILTEGKYHQIKRMFQTLGIEVLYLKRIEMAGIRLDETLPPGEVRELFPEEVELILSSG